MESALVVVGASAGGVEALRALVSTLPADLPAPVLVVLHVPAYGGSVLPAILNRAGVLPARHALDQDPLVPGEILVAPPDHHLVVSGDRVALTRGPRENGHRPAVDVLFRSAALAAGSSLVGVVLSGALDDGAAGAVAIRQRNGRVLVQSPDDATYPAMPQSVLACLRPDRVGTAAELGSVVDELVRHANPAPTPSASDLLRAERDLAAMRTGAFTDPHRPGTPAGFSCPDCGGTLFENRDGELVRFNCRVGHSWSAENLLGQQSMQLDGALWMALRGLHEKAALALQLAERAEQRGSTLSARRFHRQADEAERAATLIREMLEKAMGVTDV